MALQISLSVTGVRPLIAAHRGLALAIAGVLACQLVHFIVWMGVVSYHTYIGPSPDFTILHHLDQAIGSTLTSWVNSWGWGLKLTTNYAGATFNALSSLFDIVAVLSTLAVCFRLFYFPPGGTIEFLVNGIDVNAME